MKYSIEEYINRIQDKYLSSIDKKLYAFFDEVTTEANDTFVTINMRDKDTLRHEYIIYDNDKETNIPTIFDYSKTLMPDELNRIDSKIHKDLTEYYHRYIPMYNKYNDRVERQTRTKTN